MNKLILNDIQDLWRWREKINIDDFKEDPMAEDMPLYFPCAVVWHVDYGEHDADNYCLCSRNIRDMSVKRQIFINNKGIDGEIANNMTFDFDFNVDKNILEKIKAKKESNKLNTKDWALFSLMVLFIFAMGVVSGWLAFNCLNHG